jgi:hypothetical protein
MDGPVSAPTSLEELLEQQAILQILYRYATAIDTLDYDLLDDVFTDDGVVDFSTFEGPSGPWPTVKQWAADSLAPFPLRKHYVTNAVIELDASLERATCVSYWRSPVGAVDPDTGMPAFFESGGRYLDTLEKRAEGWRVHERVVQAEWAIGEMPAPAGVEG